MIGTGNWVGFAGCVMVRGGEAGALAGVVAFMVRKVVGLAEGGCGESCLAGVALEAVAVHGFVVGATVRTWVALGRYGGGG